MANKLGRSQKLAHLAAGEAGLEKLTCIYIWWRKFVESRAGQSIKKV